jgi:acetyl-CoA/propionyl-CoA carboxylase biotin carboxyl carrier protein
VHSGGLAPSTVAFDVEADGRWRIAVDGHVAHLTSHRSGRTTHVATGGGSWSITEIDQRGAGGDAGARTGDGTVRSPMPGTVIAVAVGKGDMVSAGQPVAIVEAMKMEHTLTAPFGGVVADVHVQPGSSVALDQLVVSIEASDATAT